MMQFHPFAGAAPQQVHAGWIDRALTDIGDEVFRQSILSAPQFAERIVAVLADADGQGTELADNHPMKTLLSFVPQDRLHAIGQLWFAPVLAETMLSPSRRGAPEIESRDQLRRLMRYRDHTTPDLVGGLPQNPDYVYEGASCLAAWLSVQQEARIARRLRLVLPPELSFVSVERIALVGRILSDPEAGSVGHG